MAFQSVPETASINQIYTLSGETVQNVHYARIAGGYALANLQALADAVGALFLATFVTELTSETVYIKTEVRGLELENDLIAESTAGAGPGTHTGDPLPNNVTFAIKKLSGLTGRSARGRVFWPGVSKGELETLDQNKLKLAYANQLRDDMESVRTTINTVPGWEAVLVSRFQDKVKRPEGVTFSWLTTTFTDLRVDTIRNRLPAG